MFLATVRMDHSDPHLYYPITIPQFVRRITSQERLFVLTSCLLAASRNKIFLLNLSDLLKSIVNENSTLESSLYLWL
jgi:hypothetical protein